MSALGWWLCSIGTYLLVAVGVARAVYADDYAITVREIQERRGTQRMPSREDVVSDNSTPAGLYGLVGLLWAIWVPFWLVYRASLPVAPAISAWWFRAAERKAQRTVS